MQKLLIERALPTLKECHLHDAVKAFDSEAEYSFVYVIRTLQTAIAEIREKHPAKSHAGWILYVEAIEVIQMLSSLMPTLLDESNLIVKTAFLGARFITNNDSMLQPHGPHYVAIKIELRNNLIDLYKYIYEVQKKQITERLEDHHNQILIESRHGRHNSI